MKIQELRDFLTSKTYRSARHLVREACQGGAARPFVEYAMSLRANRRSRRGIHQLRQALNACETAGRKPPVWFSVFEKEVYLLWRSHRQMAAPRKIVKSDLRVLVTRQTRRLLARAGLVRHTEIPLQKVAASYFTDLWSSMANDTFVMWMDNWYRQRFLTCPVLKQASLDVSVLAVLKCNAVGVPWTGHPTTNDVVNRIDVLVNELCVSQHNLRSGLLPFQRLQILDPRSIRAPLDLARPARRCLQWRPFMMCESRTGTKIELLDLLTMLNQVQQHSSNTMPLLIDSNIYYQLMKLAHCKYLERYDFGHWIQNIPLIYGVWHAYKSVCLLFFRRFLPILAFVMNSEVNAETPIYSYPKLITIEKIIAGLWVHSYELKVFLADKIKVYKHRTRPHTEKTSLGLTTLEALHIMLHEYIPAIFTIGNAVRNCHWAGGAPKTSSEAERALKRSLVLLLQMCAGHEHHTDYIRTISVALLHWTKWHSETPGQMHSEEICEAMLARLSSVCRTHPNHHTLEKTQQLFQSLEPTRFAQKIAGIMPRHTMLLLKLRLKKFMVETGQVIRPKILWGPKKTIVSEDMERGLYDYPKSLHTELDKPLLKDLLLRFMRCVVGGRRPSAEVEAFVIANCPQRTDAEVAAFRRSLRDLGSQPLVHVPRGPVPPALVQRNRRNQVVVVDSDEDAAPIIPLVEDEARDTAALLRALGH